MLLRLKYSFQWMLTVVLPFFLIFVSSCKTNPKPAYKTFTVVPNADTVSALSNSYLPIYQGAATKTHDMVHLSLQVSLNWANCTLLGKATLTLKPHFYATSNLLLDARGMDLHEVALLAKSGKHLPLNYNYQNDQINIELDKTYTSKDTFQVFVNYTAQPNLLKKKGGSAAITEDKGLYFINPDASDKTKPQQVWTQGETQSNSVWFPCIDKPNQKFTQDIAITVDNKFQTLSNGLLVKQQKNTDGTRTDYWKQTLPHSAYLVMMAVGKFSIVKDQWRGKEISYYVDPEYEKYARSMFGKTPEMIEFYSHLLGIPFVWEKYAQVVVSEYVSGAMENTTATLFGDFIEQSDREKLDHNYEDVVAHELFHHWFGDLVTCESWSNLPVNESFADYGEYLWMEHKYGRQAADGHLHRATQKYYRASAIKQVDVVRFFYADKEELFDVNTYEKGGAILHMLRKYVGDEAFFTALHKYLADNQFKNTEITQLRLAFEEVTGEDLNWFFNQWFYGSGYPELKVTHDYNSEIGVYNLHVEQTQNLKTTPFFQLPVDIDIYGNNGKRERKRIWINQKSQDFELSCPNAPLLVDFDAEKMLVGTVDEVGKSREAMAYQYKTCQLFEARYRAIEQLSDYPKSEEYLATLLNALQDSSFEIRSLAISQLQSSTLAHDEKLVKPLIELVKHDAQAAIRCDALVYLSRHFLSSDLRPLFESALKDSSYVVAGNALTCLAILDKEAAFKAASSLENTDEDQLLINILVLYSQYGADDEFSFFAKLEGRFNGMAKVNYVECLSDFVQRCNEQTIYKSIPIFRRLLNDNTKHMHKIVVQSIREINSNVSKREPDGDNPLHQELLNSLKKLLNDDN